MHVSPATPSMPVLTIATHSLNQALKELSVHELCALMKELDFNHCATAFAEECLTGDDLLEMSKEELKEMLEDTGAIANDHYAYL